MKATKLNLYYRTSLGSIQPLYRMMSSSVLGRRRCLQLTTHTGTISTQLCGISPRNESIQQYATAGRNLVSRMHTTTKISQRLTAQPIITQAALFSSNASQITETIIDDKNDIFQTTTGTHTKAALTSVIKDLDKTSQFNQGKGGIPNGLYSWCWRKEI